MIRKTVFIIFLVFLCATTSLAQIAEEEIVAEGEAAGSSLKSKDNALNRALRNAVEEAVGTLIDSETMVENFQLLNDNIYSEVKGYVSGYEIIADNEGRDGVYKVRVRAKVALGAIEKDVKALGILREKINYPRIVVLIDEYVDGVMQPRQIVAGEVEKIFVENKFPIVSQAQMEMIKEKDATLAYQDPSKAAALGRRFGAEVVIVGQATSDIIESSQPYGVPVFAYEARIEAKAVKADNAKILATASTSMTERGSGRVPTANKAISSAADEFSKSLLNEIAEAWRGEVYNEINIELICDNASLWKSKLLQNALNSGRDVRGVSERYFTNKVLVLDVRFFGSIDQLAGILEDLKEPQIRITGKTANRLDITFVDQE